MCAPSQPLRGGARVEGGRGGAAPIVRPWPFNILKKKLFVLQCSFALLFVLRLKKRQNSLFKKSIFNVFQKLLTSYT